MGSLLAPEHAFTAIARQDAAGTMLLRIHNALCERAMREDFPWRIWAVTPLQAPQDSGLPMEAEREMVAHAERELLTSIPDDGTTLFLGSIVHAGSYVCVLHSTIATAFGPPPYARYEGTHYTWDIYIEQDNDREFLVKKFILTEDEKRQLRDHEVLDALTEAGDNPVVPRPITFYGLFRTSSDAKEAGQRLQQKGFRVATPTELPGKSQYPWSLMFQRTSPTEPETIDRLSFQADTAIRQSGGNYDGWSCEPVEG